jgi:hypothetical protein
MGCCDLLFEGDGAIDLRFADDLGDAEREQSGDKPREHAADQKISDHEFPPCA